ncbi:Phospholipase/carboxylesterase/thioesterase [Pilaira anomala]|nr:Phospholipase/carboxylesterase/thioesterase [Pilaira anomala]
MSGLNKTSNEDERGMLTSISLVNSIISKEIDNGIPSERIIVGGFSQGSTLAILTGLTSEFKFAGIVGCSGWLGLASKFPAMATEANKRTPFLMCHGANDTVVNPEYGKTSAEQLKGLGYDLEFKMYPGLVHSANDEEILDIAQFIKKNLPPI